MSAGKYTELTLPQRIEERPLPEIRVVDLRQCRDLRGPGRFISAELNRAMGETLGRGEQALLFLNRRGFASFPVCAACGSALRCQHCDITLTLHQAANAYRCHYCGFSRPATTGCDGCGADKLKRLGLGTEKVEAAVAALFPGARVARMDRDTTQRKSGAVIELLRACRRVHRPTPTLDPTLSTEWLPGPPAPGGKPMNASGNRAGGAAATGPFPSAAWILKNGDGECAARGGCFGRCGRVATVSRGWATSTLRFAGGLERTQAWT